MSIFSAMLAPLNCSVSLPCLAFHRVAAVAGIPDRRCRRRAPSRAVSLPRPPVTEVVAVAADQHVVAVAAGDGVVAGAAVDVSVIRAARPLPARDRCRRRRPAMKDEIFGGADIEEERRRTDAVEAHARAVGGDGEDLVAVAAR